FQRAASQLRAAERGESKETVVILFARSGFVEGGADHVIQLRISILGCYFEGGSRDGGIRRAWLAQVALHDFLRCCNCFRISRFTQNGQQDCAQRFLLVRVARPGFPSELVSNWTELRTNKLVVAIFLLLRDQRPGLLQMRGQPVHHKPFTIWSNASTRCMNVAIE